MDATKSSDMEKLTNSCTIASEYPKNLVRPTLYEYNLNAYYERLEAQAKALFWSKPGAFVDFLESPNKQNGQSTHISTVSYTDVH